MKLLKNFLLSCFVCIVCLNPLFAEGDSVSDQFDQIKTETITKFTEKGIKFTKTQLSSIDDLYAKALTNLESSDKAISNYAIENACKNVRTKIVSDVLTKTQKDNFRSNK